MRSFRGEHGQRGVAMVTVLLIGAAMTVLVSTAAFTTIREFRAGSDDRKAAGAIAMAEAGIDRFLLYVKSGLITYRDMNKAGCGASPPLQLPAGTVGNGTFTAQMSVYDPTASGAARFPPAACTNRPTSPHPGQGGDLTYFVITSTGRHPEATRVVQQVIALKPVGLPIGLYANSIDIQSAKHEFVTISMVAETTINNRGQVGFAGDDSFYLVRDFYGTDVTGISPDAPIPAAAHAATQILVGKSSNPEFTGGTAGTHNCTANNAGVPGVLARQALWDGDGSDGSGVIPAASVTGDPNCNGQTGFPNSSKFTVEQLDAFAKPELSTEDHQTLKEAAKRYGVYCSLVGNPAPVGDSAANNFCIKQDVQQGAATDYHNMIESVSTTRNSFVTYIEYRGGDVKNNNLSEPFDVWGCTDTNPDPPDTNKSVVVIVRNGGVNFTGAAGTQISGAFLLDGDWEARGGIEFDGTIIAGGAIKITSSAQKLGLSDCWVSNMPGPFFTTIPGHWSEIDR